MPTQPGSPAAQVPPGEDALIRRVQELERVVRELGPSIAGSFGPVIADLQEQQSHTILPARFSAVTTGWGVPSSAWYTLATVTTPTPAGYTRALVVAHGYWRITYTVAGSKILGGRCRIQSAAGDEGDVYMDPITTRSLSTFQTGLVESLTEGDGVTVDVQIDTPDVSGADANNIARISGVVLWLR
jgi:hypothetical protein